MEANPGAGTAHVRDQRAVVETGEKRPERITNGNGGVPSETTNSQHRSAVKR
jgi:hypothetical protein